MMPLARFGTGTLATLRALLCATSVAAYDEDRPRAFRHAEPGNVDYYALVLSWSPTHCLAEGDDRGDPQCDPGRPDDFVLHGFWPQYAKGWPEDCYTGKRPWIPEDVIDGMRDIMPSKGVIIHEYKTHGTCSGVTPSAYFAMVRKVYERVTIPTAFDAPKIQRSVSPETVEKEFMAANDWLDADMIAVTCRRGNLYDVRICFSDDLRPRACGANFDQQALCPLRRITVTAP